MECGKGAGAFVFLKGNKPIKMSLELTCKMISALQEQTGNGKNGPWVKQDFIVETEEQYPKKVCLSAWGDMVQQFKAYQPGTRLKVNIRVESREYNNRWYTDVRPWRAEVLGTSSQAAPSYNVTGNYSPQPVAETVSANDVNDDLPF